MLQLLDTATRQLSEVVRAPDGSVGLYVCGPTVYGPPHVGHGRMALVYDVLRRYLEHGGARVEHVMNVTDIDDKIIDRARQERRGTGDVAAEAEAQWWSAMDSLGVLRPRHVTHATDFVDQMVELVAELIAAGAAYRASDGVYLSVSAVPGYGLLAHQSLDELRAGARVELGEQKRSPADFALWKAAKPGEPAWQAPFGEGRPGWHTECVVMSLAVLGEGFSLHGGGQDLIFPHHENERAQAVALGKAFARQWVHSGLVVAGGDKMSKSTGNVLAIGEIGEIADPRAYRLLVLRSHYRSPLEVVPEVLVDAGRQVERVDAFSRRLQSSLSQLPEGAATGRLQGTAGCGRAPDDEKQEAAGAPAAGSGEAARLAASFHAAMNDDLDTPRALAALFEAIRRANSLLDTGDAAGAGALGARALELLGAMGLHAASTGEAPPVVLELATRRGAARRGGDYALSDALRAEIEQLGWQVEDTRGGFELRRRPGV